MRKRYKKTRNRVDMQLEQIREIETILFNLIENRFISKHTNMIDEQIEYYQHKYVNAKVR